ncbi:uncharacterized protein LOC128862041 [Anastrepha ludens]|uniref:uncharacterized protein LOC128862041 n=1 Tax=Anastrepha ludens TaxID=28586 RepID=UPI0023B0BEF9|nr:uncharacterized protein LOC128862041 [Anastrepha ludens]
MVDRESGYFSDELITDLENGYRYQELGENPTLAYLPTELQKRIGLLEMHSGVETHWPIYYLIIEERLTIPLYLICDSNPPHFNSTQKLTICVQLLTKGVGNQETTTQRIIPCIIASYLCTTITERFCCVVTNAHIPN